MQTITWPKLAKRRRYQRGGAISSFIKLSLFLALIIGIDGFVTTQALQGTWRMEMPDNVDDHLHALVFAQNQNKSGKRSILGGALRDSLTRGLSKIGGSLLSVTAENVRIKMSGQHFEIQATKSEAESLTRLMSAVAQPDGDPIDCSSGKILAAYPIAHITCYNEGPDESVLFLMRGWPGQTVLLFPLPIGEKELRERAERVQQSLSQSGDIEPPSPEVIEAMKELFTLRFVKTN